MITRQEADDISIVRQSAIAEIDPEITKNWHRCSDREKATYLDAALLECNWQIVQFGDPDITKAIEWEMSELTKALEFFRVASGLAPMEGQLALLAAVKTRESA